MNNSNPKSKKLYIEMVSRDHFIFHFSETEKMSITKTRANSKTLVESTHLAQTNKNRPIEIEHDLWQIYLGKDESSKLGDNLKWFYTCEDAISYLLTYICKSNLDET